MARRQAFLGRPTVHGMGVGLAISGRRRDGSEFPIEVSLAPLDLGPDKLVSASVRDVTDRQRAERDLARARDEAVAAAQLKSQFVAMVSHEIRTPMNGVLGLTDLLLDTPLDLTQRRYVETIGSSGRALLTIINDILDFSKIESGQIELASADLDLRRLLEEVACVAAELARDKDIVVTGYYPPALPRVVRGDAGRLRQALLNLVGNAVKFTRRGDGARLGGTHARRRGDVRRHRHRDRHRARRRGPPAASRSRRATTWPTGASAAPGWA